MSLHLQGASERASHRLAAPRGGGRDCDLGRGGGRSSHLEVLPALHRLQGCNPVCHLLPVISTQDELPTWSDDLEKDTGNMQRVHKQMTGASSDRNVPKRSEKFQNFHCTLSFFFHEKVLLHSGSQWTRT